ncbi:hypothetical protein GCM10017786_71120 [Amycolatopsis deserti]|uniref:Insertion element IS402-like domain-containing protein n=1 Tax=Amycolatopsis deserti TaxID=185696 RepID=A0ABQ3JI19_9PSEU|nr:hypothetical protein GCM10017786_71120 [Amycolatopsis deserti]
MINAILWKLHTGAPWRDLPERYGPWKTAHERLWTADGTWQKILDGVIVKDDSIGEVEWIISIDSSVVQIPRRAARGSRGGRPPAFESEAYQWRNVIERYFNRPTQFRNLATHYAKRATYYQAELAIAAIILWLR